MMRVLVTGGAGFLGSHFIRRWRARHPADAVVNFDALTYAGSPERLADVASSPGYRFVRGDVCDAPALRQAMGGCGLAVHFAAETHVDRSITDAAPFIRTNVEGAYQLLAAAKTLGVARVVFVSTDEVYGPVLQDALSEDAPLSPRSPYAASKAAGDLLAQAFWHTHGLPVIVARPTNIFGPGQLPEKFLPLCITSALEERPIPVYGDGGQRRAWLFVDDFCDAMDLLAQRGEPGQVYNIAGGTEQANLDTVRRVLRQMGKPERLIQLVADRPGHDRRYAMNDAKLRGLGWAPQTSFERGLSATAAWYQGHAAWWKPLVQRLREDPYHWLNRPAGSGPVPKAVGRPA